MTSKKGILLGALLGSAALTGIVGAAQAHDFRHYFNRYVVYAKNGAELAAGIEKANARSSIKYITCIRRDGCDHKGSLPTYTGSQRLKIDGNGSTIVADSSDDVFASVGGGSLGLMRLNFQGGLSGIYVEVPSDQERTQDVALWRVSVKGAALHGLFINDENSAPAGVRVALISSRFSENGFEADSQNGVNVVESGNGDVTARLYYSSFNENGADGFGIGESGDGDVSVRVVKSRFRGNGANPANPSDPDDGLDIDETGNGNVRLSVAYSHFTENYDDGVDIDERDEGHLESRLYRVRANDNGDQGMTFDERAGGDFSVTVKQSQVVDNDLGSQEYDIRAEQSGDGNGNLTLENTETGNIARSGVVVTVVP